MSILLWRLGNNLAEYTVMAKLMSHINKRLAKEHHRTGEFTIHILVMTWIDLFDYMEIFKEFLFVYLLKIWTIYIVVASWQKYLPINYSIQSVKRRFKIKIWFTDPQPPPPSSYNRGWDLQSTPGNPLLNEQQTRQKPKQSQTKPPLFSRLQAPTHPHTLSSHKAASLNAPQWFSSLGKSPPPPPPIQWKVHAVCLNPKFLGGNYMTWHLEYIIQNSTSVFCSLFMHLDFAETIQGGKRKWNAIQLYKTCSWATTLSFPLKLIGVIN